MVLKHGLTVGGRSLVEHLEAINHQHAIDFVEQLATQPEAISEDGIKAIHRLVLRTIDDDYAGTAVRLGC